MDGHAQETKKLTLLGGMLGIHSSQLLDAEKNQNPPIIEHTEIAGCI